MKTLKIFQASLLIVTCALSFNAAAQFSIGVRITVAPPPIPVYEQPVCSNEGFVWVPGYWDYDEYSNDYYWVEGRWTRPARVGWFWTPGYWVCDGGYYRWNRGYWGPTVGYYGGVCYGYGYYGDGFCGGRWKGNRFYYNTAAWRVNNASVHYTYNDHSRVMEPGRGDRRSYHGPRRDRNEGPNHSERVRGNQPNYSGGRERVFRDNPRREHVDRGDFGRQRDHGPRRNQQGGPRGGGQGRDEQQGGGGRRGR